MILNFVHLHIQHIVMNAKVSYGVLQGKVLNVENVELNAMKNAKIFSMLIVYNVSSNFLSFNRFLVVCMANTILFQYHYFTCPTLMTIQMRRQVCSSSEIHSFNLLVFFLKIIPIIMLITSHAIFIYHIKEDFDLNNSCFFFVDRSSTEKCETWR